MKTYNRIWSVVLTLALALTMFPASSIKASAAGEADAVAAAISGWNASAASGSLGVSINGDTVTVTGAVTFNSSRRPSSLTLTIPAGVTVDWKANLDINFVSPAIYDELTLRGAGVFILGGTYTYTGPSGYQPSAVDLGENVHFILDGGTVRNNNSQALGVTNSLSWRPRITLKSGYLTGYSRSAIYIANANASVTISIEGGTVDYISGVAPLGVIDLTSGNVDLFLMGGQVVKPSNSSVYVRGGTANIYYLGGTCNGVDPIVIGSTATPGNLNIYYIGTYKKPGFSNASAEQRGVDLSALALSKADGTEYVYSAETPEKGVAVYAAFSGALDLAGAAVTPTAGRFDAANKRIVFSEKLNDPNITVTVSGAKIGGLPLSDFTTSAFGVNFEFRETAPSAPQNLKLTPGQREITATWDPPVSDGGRPVTGYVVENSGVTLPVTVGPAVRSHTFTGLQFDKTYSIGIRAVNAIGQGATVSDTAQPYSELPGTPQNLKLKPNDGRITAVWEAPDGDGGAPITGYRIYLLDGDEKTTGPDNLTVDFDGLTNGKDYTVSVAAVNAKGESADRAQAQIAPKIVIPPGAPQGLILFPGNGEIEASWEAPSDSGSNGLAEYRISVGPRDSIAPGDWKEYKTDALERTIVLTGLKNEREYKVVVYAVNADEAVSPGGAYGFAKPGAKPVRMYLDAEYLALKAGGAADTRALTAFLENGLPLPAGLVWESSNAAAVKVEADPVVPGAATVTAVGEGTAIITAKIVDKGLAAECRVDVIDAGGDAAVANMVTGVNLLAKTITSNVLSTDYARAPLQLVLRQNAPAALAALGTGGLAPFAIPPDTGNTIEKVTLPGDKAGYFIPRVVDDKYIELIPNLDPVSGPSPNIIDAAKVKQIKTRVEVTLKDAGGATFTRLTTELTINIVRKAPKLKAAAIKFNPFFPNTEMPVNITTSAGRIEGIRLLEKNDHLKVGYDMAGNTLKLATETSKPKKLQFEVTLSGFAEGRNKFTVAQSVSVTSKKPSVKLSAKSVTMRKEAGLRITGTGLANAESIRVANSDSYETSGWKEGGFVLKYTGDGTGGDGIVPKKANLKLEVSFQGSTQKVSLPLTVNKPGAVKANLSKTKVTLNKALPGAAGTEGDSATVNFVMTPVDAPAPAGVEYLNGAGKFIAADYDGAAKKVTVTLTDEAVKDKNYKLKIGSATLTVNAIDKIPSISLKQKGTLNVLDPGSMSTLTPKFTNFSYGGATVTLEPGKRDNAKFMIVPGSLNTQTGSVKLRLADAASKPVTGQYVVLTYTDGRGSYDTTAIKITPKQLKPKISQSVKQITLQKNDLFSEGRIDVSVTSPAGARIESVEVNSVYARLYNARKIQGGSWAIGYARYDKGGRVIDQAYGDAIGKVKNGTIKLDVRFAGGAKPVTISVKMVIK